MWREADVIGMRFAGPLTLPEVEVLRDLMHLVRREHGRCYMLADAHGLTGIAIEARKALSEWGRTDPEDRMAGVGVHGISFAMRALSTLTLGAMKIMSSRPLQIHFAADEAEARAWLVARRAADDRQAR